MSSSTRTCVLSARRSAACWVVLAALVPVPTAGRTIDGSHHPIPEVVGHVLFHQKISQTSGGFTGALQEDDRLGRAAATLGDLDGDGTVDLAVGAPGDDDGGLDRGAVWIFFLRPNGTVKAHQKISDAEGGFIGALDDFDSFGSSLASLGDLDGDGTPDLAVGAIQDDDGGLDRGAVWILFLHPNGTVKGHQKISASAGGFTGTLDDMDVFGAALASLGDLNGDGTAELAVGAFLDDDGGADRGAVWILFLQANGTVAAHQKISATAGGFTGTLDDADILGRSLTSLGAVDGGTARLAVGAPGDDDGSLDAGALWILTLQPNGTVGTQEKVSATAGQFTGTLDEGDNFGGALASLGDLDCDGTVDLAVGATEDDDGGAQRGAVWVLFLAPRGTVNLHTKISDTSGSFTGALDDGDFLGSALSALGDLDGDGHVDLAVGAAGDDDGGSGSMFSELGAVWNLFLDGTECTDPTIFEDGFESGDTTFWSETLD